MIKQTDISYGIIYQKATFQTIYTFCPLTISIYTVYHRPTKYVIIRHLSKNISPTTFKPILFNESGPQCLLLFGIPKDRSKFPQNSFP